MTGVKVFATQLCLILCDPLNCSPQGFSVHGILQARILKWVTNHSLLQRIFLTQGSNLGFLHSSAILTSEPLGKPILSTVGEINFKHLTFLPTERLQIRRFHPQTAMLLLLLSRFSHVRLCATP